MTAEQFKNIRRNLKISQEEMARIAGVSKATISRWERKVFNPSFLSWAKIRDFCKKEDVELEKVASPQTLKTEKEKTEYIIKLKFDDEQFSDIIKILKEIKSFLSFYRIKEELRKLAED